MKAIVNEGKLLPDDIVFKVRAAQRPRAATAAQRLECRAHQARLQQGRR
jgi:hypothetical protein